MTEEEKALVTRLCELEGMLSRMLYLQRDGQVILDEIGRGLFKLSGQTEPLPCRHVLWGDQVICDGRSQHLWQRHDGQTYRVLSTFVDDEGKVNKGVFEDYQAENPCLGCLKRLPEIISGVDDVYKEVMNGWRHVLSQP